MTTSYTLTPYDLRNPSSYERRLGYPVPDEAWFDKSLDAKKEDAVMSYTKERFLIGFNLNVREFLMLRKDVAVQALERGLQDKTLALNKKGPRRKATEVVRYTRSHPLLNVQLPWEVPAWWFDVMTKHFVTRGVVSDYLRTFSDTFSKPLDELIATDYETKVNFAWSSLRVSDEVFSGYFQFQDCKIRIKGMTAATSIEIPVTTLLATPLGNRTEADLDLGQLRFDKLKQTITANGSLGPWSETSELRAPRESSASNYLLVEDDESLRIALRMCRRKAKISIRIYFVETTVRDELAVEGEEAGENEGSESTVARRTKRKADLQAAPEEGGSVKKKGKLSQVYGRFAKKKRNEGS